MAGKDPFAEFGGHADPLPSAPQNDPFAEFGGHADTSVAQQPPTPGSEDRKFYPDTNMSTGEMVGTSIVEGITGLKASDAGAVGLKQALKDRSISQEQYDQMSQQMQQEQASGKSHSQQLETKQAENPTLAGSADLAGQAIQAAGTQPAFDLGFAGVMKAGSSVLRRVGRAASKSAIPGIAKLGKKVGGDAGIERIADVLDKYEVMNTPSFTLKTLENKVENVTKIVGKELETGLQAIDSATSAGVRGDKVVAAVMDDWHTTYKAMNGVVPPKSAQKLMLSTVEDYIDSGSLYSHTDIAKIATDIQKQAWQKPAINAAKNDVQAGFAFRSANLKLAEEAGASPQALQVVRDASGEYNKIRAAQTAIQQKLSKKPTSVGIASEFLRHSIAASGGPITKTADIAYTLGRTTGAKTSLAASAKLGAKILSSAADMGPWQKIMLNIASKKGLSKLQDWHVHQMISNDNYANMFESAQANQQ